MSEETVMVPTNDYVFRRIFAREGSEKITAKFIESITNKRINEIRERAERRLDYVRCQHVAEDYGLQRGLKRGYDKGYNQGEKDGYNQGMKDGYDKGREQERIDIIEKALTLGLTMEQITELLGIEKEKIEKMKKEIQSNNEK